MLNRRDFARLSVVAAAAPLISAAAPKPAVIKPKRLSPGDTVGLVLPATAAFEADEIQFAKEQMEAIGFKVVI
ncbi:MAG: muramoyltetrapeptide carboxypeptidase, partial [Thermoanaerobaculia bacterium]|nr:muramoyltetrapeptide carboxypeptidase [Thermoanaerobaculia bacterium]